MLMNEEHMAKLRRYFGINLYEVKIWSALLSKGVSTAGELSEISNVPRSRAYDILESLEKKGFAMMKLGKPIKYMAVPPEEVIDRAKKYMEIESVKRINRLESIKNTELLGKLNEFYNAGISMLKPGEYTGIVKGKKNIMNQISSMIKNAEREVTIVTTESSLLEKMDFLKNVIKMANKKGVKIKMAAPITKNNRAKMDEFKGMVEFKQIKENSGRFCVADNKEVLMMLKDTEEVHPNYDTGIWMNSTSMGTTLSHIFDRI